MNHKVKRIRRLRLWQASETEQEEFEAWMSENRGYGKKIEDIEVEHYNATTICGEQGDNSDGSFRMIEERMAVIRRQQGRFRNCKIFAASLFISMAVFLTVITFVNKSGIPSGANTGDMSQILLTQSIAVKDAPVGNILKMLEDDYDMRFSVTEADILSIEFTGTFSRGITIENIISTLAQSGNFTYGPRSLNRFVLKPIDVTDDQSNATHH